MMKPGLRGFRTVFAITAAVFLTTSASGLLRAEDSCDASTLTGNYGYKLSGYLYDGRGYSYYLAAIGSASADGAGNISGSETMSFDGTILKLKFTGTYTINADCTGSMTLQYSDNSTTHADIVILNDAKEVNFIQTDPGVIYSGVLKKQKTQTAPPSPTPAQ